MNPPSIRSTRLLALLALAGLAACGQDEPARMPPTTTWPVVVERGVEAQPEYERVVLVTIDTLRADHVSSYGYPRQTTPFLDSLAARGVRFARAMAAISHTAPSHATMLTGLVPAVHGVVRNGESLEASALDAAQLFGSAGFESAAFLNAKFLSGVAGSFGTVVVRGAGGKQPHSGADVVDAAIAWLKGQPAGQPAGRREEQRAGLREEPRKGPRFLLWVHLYDPHEWQARMHFSEEGSPVWTGTSPADFRDYILALHGLPAFEPGQPYEVKWGKDRRPEERVQDSKLETFLRGIDHYDELVLFADRQVERLHATIEGLALPGKTLWIVTADHGEGLASHETTGHGEQIFQEQLHVPLILHASDGSLGPRVVEELVGHIDLLPTLSEALGLRVHGNPRLFEGRSLWPLARGQSQGWGARPVFAQRRPVEGGPDPDEVYALQSASHKLILHDPGEDLLFDLARDPKELSTLGAEHDAAAELRAGLEERLKAYRGLGSGDPESVPEEWLQELHELGY